jgi:alpha-galactosidase
MPQNSMGVNFMQRLRIAAEAEIMGNMEKTLNIAGLTLQVSANTIEENGNWITLKGVQVNLKLPQNPARYLRHGWQSWSLAAWTDPAPMEISRPRILFPLQMDPKYAEEKLPNGSWLGAVEFGDGKVLLLGALSLDTHVRLSSTLLEGWSEAGEAEWMVACGAEDEIFDSYAGMLAGKLGKPPLKPAPHIWCSWYSLYTAIDEPLLFRTFDELKAFPFDILQVDDGWEKSIGDWEANSKFPSGMPALAQKIKSTGRIAGLWLAPLIAVKSSRLFHAHPDWFLRDDLGRLVSAGFNWGEQVYPLDTTQPVVLAWLETLMKQVREWGFDYLKLDFLYAGALPGKRHQDLPREQAYRLGLERMRKAMGEDAYFLACGAPILPSLGLCDALRVGPDVSGEWESHRDAVLLANFATPGTLNAIRTTLHELWLKPLVQIDPDVAFFSTHGNSLTMAQKRVLQDLALICGFKATSELPQWLMEEEKKELMDFLEDPSAPTQTGRYSFSMGKRQADFTDLLRLPSPASGVDVIAAPILGWLASQPFALRIFDRLNKRSLEKMRHELDLDSPAHPSKR